MRKILSNNLLRQLTMTELIINKVAQTIGQLSQQMSVSEKTIRRDIAVINNNIKPLEIKVKPSDECYLLWQSDYNLAYIYSCFLKASTDYQILEKVLIEETLTYNELADAVFVSVSTLRRSLARMNDVLVDYDIEIVSNPVRVRGDERQIVSFLYSYLKTKYLVSDNFFSQFESNAIDDMLANLLDQCDQGWQFTKSEMLKRLIKSHVIRLKNGNRMLLKPIGGETEAEGLLSKLAPYNTRLEKMFGVSPLPQIITKMAEDNYALSSNGFKKIVNENSFVAEKVTAIAEIIETVGNQFMVTNADTDKLILRLYNRMIFSCGTTWVLSDPAAEFVNRLEKDRPVFVKLLKKQYALNETILGKGGFSTFAFYLVTEWPQLFGISQSKKKMNVGLFFSTSNNHIAFIQTELRKKLNQRVALVNLNGHPLSMLDNADVDLIVTDISGLSVTHKKICVSGYINDDDLIKIIIAYSLWESDN